MTTRLVLVDGDSCYRESLALALTTFHGFEIAGQAGTFREALSVIDDVQPDLAITDLLQRDSDGLPFALELRRRRCQAPLMLLTSVSYPLFLEQSLALGVRGYTLKEEGLADLADAIRQVLSGENYVSPACGIVPCRSRHRSGQCPHGKGRSCACCSRAGPARRLQHVST